MNLKINDEDTICLLEYAPDTFKWNDNVQPVCLSDSFDPQRTCYSVKGFKETNDRPLVQPGPDVRETPISFEFWKWCP